MAEKDLEHLVRLVAYMFYEGNAVMVLTKLLEIGEPVTDEELSKRLKFKRSDLDKVLGPLENDGLVVRESLVNMDEVDDPDDLKPSQRKKLMRDYWSLDFKSLIDSIQYKILMMKKLLRERCPMDKVYYQCPKCKEEDGGNKGHVKRFIYELQDLLKVGNFEDTEFLCPACQTRLEDVDDTNEVNESKRLIREFDKMVQPLLDIINTACEEDPERRLVLENDRDKRCKPDKMIRKQDYEREREKIRQDKARQRIVHRSQTNTPHLKPGDGTTLDFVVKTEEQKVEKKPVADADRSVLESLANHRARGSQPILNEEATIELRGKTYTAAQLTEDVINSLGLTDEEYGRVMEFCQENEME